MSCIRTQRNRGIGYFISSAKILNFRSNICNYTGKHFLTHQPIPFNNIITNMKAYKSGERPAKVMHQLAKGYTDEQIELIANYLGKKD